MLASHLPPYLHLQLLGVERLHISTSHTEMIYDIGSKAVSPGYAPLHFLISVTPEKSGLTFMESQKTAALARPELERFERDKAGYLGQSSSCCDRALLRQARGAERSKLCLARCSWPAGPGYENAHGIRQHCYRWQMAARKTAARLHAENPC